MRIAQVVPDLATFAVDDGFAYRVPDELAGVSVGSMVRVPLGNRRVRGFVVGVRDGEAAGLKAVAAVSGDVAIFDKRLLETLRWAALHYVAPLSVVLSKAAPPNLGRRRAAKGPWAPVGTMPDGELLGAISRGRRSRPAYLVGPSPHAEETTDLVAAALSRNRSALVVAATVTEAQAAAAGLADVFGDRVVTGWSSMAAKDVTASWVTSAVSEGTVVVGTRETAWWPHLRLGVAVVLGEGRRGMKEPQTPTTHVRDVLRRRGAVERFPVVSIGAVPTTDTIAAGVELLVRPGRSWPLAEVVDRTEEPPGSGVLTDRVRSALRSVTSRSGTAFVLCRLRGDVVRCAQCRTLRLCEACDTSVGRNSNCPRCGAATGSCASCGGGRFSPAAASAPRVLEEVSGITEAGLAGSGAPVVVGTERDMPAPRSVDIAVAVDGDGAVFAANYRAAEDALRLMARLAQTVRRGRTNRAIVQTSRPDHPVYEALRRGNAMAFLSEELAARTADGFPPVGELIAIEIERPPPSLAGDLAGAAGSDATLLGPADSGGRQRWLIAGPDLRRVRIALRGQVQSWREAKARVRVDVDPIDL